MYEYSVSKGSESTDCREILDETTTNLVEKCRAAVDDVESRKAEVLPAQMLMLDLAKHANGLNEEAQFLVQTHLDTLAERLNAVTTERTQLTTPRHHRYSHVVVLILLLFIVIVLIAAIYFVFV